MELVYASMQGAECGEGFQRRNLSCVVHWGDWPKSPPQRVQEELCGDKLMIRTQQEMEQPCFVPCPGEAALRQSTSYIITHHIHSVYGVLLLTHLHEMYSVWNNACKLVQAVNLASYLNFINFPSSFLPGNPPAALCAYCFLCF